MTPMMPDAPAPQMNRMMAPGAPPGGPPAAGGMMPPQNAMQAPPQAPAPQPTPEEIAQSRKHVGAIMSGLIKLTSKPKGDLTKKDVFEAASDMIAEGAFPGSEAKQDLIVRLAELPDDEPGLRKALGTMLLGVSTAREHLHGTFGTGEPAGAPNAGI